MKRKYLMVVAALALCLLGCARELPPETTIPTTTATATVPPTTQPPRITVYPGAVENYLGDIYDFSWEQLYPPEYVMLHFCSAVVNHPEDPYNMEYVRQTFIDADVSVHYIIDRDGTVYCYIPEDRTAWHAGAGQWAGDEKYTDKMNFYAIGIELVGIGSREDMSLYITKAQYNKLDKTLLGFTDAQYVALSALLEDVCGRNGIPMDREHVIGHEDFNPKRNDPGQLFDWNRILPQKMELSF